MGHKDQRDHLVKMENQDLRDLLECKVNKVNSIGFNYSSAKFLSICSQM